MAAVDRYVMKIESESSVFGIFADIRNVRIAPIL